MGWARNEMQPQRCRIRRSYALSLLLLLCPLRTYTF